MPQILRRVRVMAAVLGIDILDVCKEAGVNYSVINRVEKNGIRHCAE